MQLWGVAMRLWVGRETRLLTLLESMHLTPDLGGGYAAVGRERN